MKRIFTIFAVVMVLVFTAAPAFAAESEITPVTVNAPVTVTVEDNAPVMVVGMDGGSAVRSAFVAALVEIFGEYTPLTQTVTTYFADGSSVQSVEVVPGLAGLDWVWISAVALFGVAIFCILRMIGGVLKWK